MKKNTLKTPKKIAEKAKKNQFKSEPEKKQTGSRRAQKRPERILREELSESEKRDIIDTVAAENETSCIILENPSYPTGLVGYTFDDDGKMRAVYSEERIIDDLMNVEGMTEEDAWDWYSVNTQRGLPYCHTDDAPCPIIIHTFR